MEDIQYRRVELAAATTVRLETLVVPLGFSALLLGVGCASSGFTSEACQTAALTQASAEQRWGAAVEAHQIAHESDIDNHEGIADRMISARVEMILAEAETRRQCS